MREEKITGKTMGFYKKEVGTATEERKGDLSSVVPQKKIGAGAHIKRKKNLCNWLRCNQWRGVRKEFSRRRWKVYLLY